MTFNKRVRGVWLTNKDWKILQLKAKEIYPDVRKGIMEKFFEKIAHETVIFVNAERDTTIKVSTHKK